MQYALSTVLCIIIHKTADHGLYWVLWQRWYINGVLVSDCNYFNGDKERLKLRGGIVLNKGFNGKKEGLELDVG